MHFSSSLFVNTNRGRHTTLAAAACITLLSRDFDSLFRANQISKFTARLHLQFGWTVRLSKLGWLLKNVNPNLGREIEAALYPVMDLENLLSAAASGLVIYGSSEISGFE